MKVSCLCPTFNRFPNLRILLDEAVECFLRQDYEDRELVICNDTPGQSLLYDHPKVKVLNWPHRFPTLSDKIAYMVGYSSGELLCRWDDDDIHLPWRLSYSVERLGNKLEWRADNHWYMERGEIKKETVKPGNSHTMAIWRRELLDRIGGYPAGLSGNEDQVFNRLLATNAINFSGEKIPRKDIFYIYRWATGSQHLSGQAGGLSHNPHQPHYDSIGRNAVLYGSFSIDPKWRVDYVEYARAACSLPKE